MGNQETILQNLATVSSENCATWQKPLKGKKTGEIREFCCLSNMMTKILYNNQIVSFISTNQWTESKIIIDIVF
jgi:hypothetical protein